LPANLGDRYRAGVRMLALLKGVNVGARNKVPMADLRSLLAVRGFSDVKSLLQSGNVVLDCPAEKLPDLAAEIEDLLRDRFSVSTRVVVRDSLAVAEVMASDPLISTMTDPARHLIGFASDVPARDRVEPLNGADYGSDLLRIEGKHVYMWCPAGISASPFFKMDFDRLLGVSVTSRNWRTVTKLSELLGDGSST
jgi:uncharacterized protein (DUF1697 family)